jgi:hypothetical protein
MVIGVLPDAAMIDTLLNNLAEADFDLDDVSVLMNDTVQRATIADDAGPLKGVALTGLADHLTRAGLARREAGRYADAVRSGKVLIVINTSTDAEAAAHEMLRDHSAQHVKGWH